eukprot:8701203-Karenia_brevis.AAC.1
MQLARVLSHETVCSGRTWPWIHWRGRACRLDLTWYRSLLLKTIYDLVIWSKAGNGTRIDLKRC